TDSCVGSALQRLFANHSPLWRIARRGRPDFAVSRVSRDMRVQIRIVAGTLRGRKLTCTLIGDVRPTPDMVRQALFSILGDAVPERPFIDVFAGTGAVGIEALSRGAREALFIERE